MLKLLILQAALITGVAIGLNLSGSHGYIVAVCLLILVIAGLCASSDDSEDEQVASQIMVCVEGFLLVITYLFSGLPQAIILATILSLCVRAATTKGILGVLGGTIVPLSICGLVWLSGNNASVDAEQYEGYEKRLQNIETLRNLFEGFSAYFSDLGKILTTAATPPFNLTGDALQDIVIFTLGIALLSLACQSATTFVAKYFQ